MLGHQNKNSSTSKNNKNVQVQDILFFVIVYFLTRKLSGSRKGTNVSSQDSVGDKFKDY